MICFWLTLIAAVFTWTDLGIARHRSLMSLGTLVLALLVAAGEQLLGHTPAGIIGVAAGVASILLLRQLGRWLLDGGALLLGALFAEFTRAAVPVIVNLLYAMVIRVCEVFSPAPTPEGLVLEQSAPVSRDWSHRYATAQEMRWSGPVETALEMGETTGDTAQETALTPHLHSVETYADWLPDSVENAGGFNAAARAAKQIFDVSRAKFARDLAEFRREQEPAA